MKAVTRANRTRRFAAMLSMAFIAAFLPAAGPASAEHYTNTVELTGETPVDAAIAWSQLAFPEGAPEAALGRSDDFPDSLASGVLQASRPLLLTATDQLDAATSEELERLSVAKVFILGGTSAISEAVEGQLTEAGYEVVRVAGTNRIETAVEVAKAGAAEATGAIIARAFAEGDDPSRAFADSLAAGAWSAASGMPVLLTETEKLSDATSAYLEASSIESANVVGGSSAVSDETVAQLEALGVTVKRISGPTRFETALAIANERGFASAADATRVIVTEGQAPDAWPSGFAAAALAKADDAPVVLLNQGEIPEPTQTFLGGENAEIGLVCSPKVTVEACGTVAEAMQKAPGAGLITIELTSVARHEELVGKVATPETVSSLKVSGCGYTEEPIHVYADGTFYLMMGEEGTCSLSFAVTAGGQSLTETIEATVGPPAVLESGTDRPELRHVHIVKTDAEGTHLRYAFDTAVSTTIDTEQTSTEGCSDTVTKPCGGWFWLLKHNGDVNRDPVSIMRDPRSPRDVLVVFPTSEVRIATAAAVGSGVRREVETNNASAILEHAPVKNAVGQGNPEGWAPLQPVPDDSGFKRPALVRVGDYDAQTQSVLFEFDKAVKVPAASGPGDAYLILTDGTIKQANENGFSAGTDDRTLRVSFTAAGLAQSDWDRVRRAFVEEGTVESASTTDTDQFNAPVAAVVEGGGLTAGPDFIQHKSIEKAVNNTKTKVTFVFDEDLILSEKPQCASTSQDVALVESDGTTHYCVNDPLPAINGRELTVHFAEALELADIRYFTVRRGAVKGFLSGLDSEADTIANLSTKVHDAGTTAGLDLTELRATTGSTDRRCVQTINCGQASFFLFRWKADQALSTNSATNTPWKVFDADGAVYHLVRPAAASCPAAQCPKTTGDCAGTDTVGQPSGAQTEGPRLYCVSFTGNAITIATAPDHVPTGVKTTGSPPALANIPYMSVPSGALLDGRAEPKPNPPLGGFVTG